MKNNFKLIAIIIFSVYNFISCSNEKTIRILGYGYKNDKIFILSNNEKMVNIRLDGNQDINKLCSFYKDELKIIASSNVKLNIKIDSSNFSVLDTCIFISKKLKKPLISFMYPDAKSKFRREIFLGDENDKKYIKY